MSRENFNGPLSKKHLIYDSRSLTRCRQHFEEVMCIFALCASLFIYN